MTLDALEIDREAFLVFIRSKKPSYPACEKWILDAKGGSLDSAVVKKHNESIIGYQHDDATRKEISVDVSDLALTQRRESWRRPASPVSRGALAKYRSSVSSASEGAVTIPPPWDE